MHNTSRSRWTAVSAGAMAAILLTLSAPAWADAGAQELRASPAPEARSNEALDRYLSLGGLGVMYAGLYSWTYFAWYKGRSISDELVVRDEGWFGYDTYAGGSDKLGHMYSNYVIHRSTYALLRNGGWSPGWSSALAGGLTMTFFTVIELKDGYHAGFGFSWGDMAFNTLGNLLAVGMAQAPRLDELLDFRVEYIPSDLFVQQLIERGVVDAAEDYSGQTFLLALHLNEISSLRPLPGFGMFRYLDLLVGYQTRNYLPHPADPSATRDQRLYVGLGLNSQLLFDEGRARDEEIPRAVHHLTEVYSLPYLSNLPITRDDAPPLPLRQTP